MKKAIKNVINYLNSKVLIFNNPFYFEGIANDDYRLNDDLVLLKRLGVSVDRHQGQSLIRGYSYAIKIQEALGARFSVSKDKIFLEIQDLKFQINSSEELFIIYEVFVTGVYKYCCLRDSLFIDVGMNSAITTLFYAQDSMIKKVFSYELFAPTYELGFQNLVLNEKYRGKVKAFNFGLSNREFETIIDYSLSRKGRMGLKGPPSDEQFSDITKQKVSIKNINQVFHEIFSDLECKSLDVVLKMDCEGEEYNLISSLSESGLLGKITVLIIEWHYQRPTQIESHLKDFNFHVFSQVLPSLDSGMIYASKS